MPSQLCEPTSAPAMRVGALMLVGVTLVGLLGCSGAQSAATSTVSEPAIATLPELERRVRTGDAKGAAALASVMRAKGGCRAAGVGA